ncbi:MAG: C45 family peptidase [Chlamydiota bacterium]
MTSATQTPLVLHVEGSPFEMGYAHGSTLKDKIRQNIENHLKNPSLSEEAKLKVQAFSVKIPSILPHIPKKYIEEMEGVAKGADVPFSEILWLNLFPEMFHCCAVTVTGKASIDASLYHARLLDYAVGKDLQSSAVLLVAKPNNTIPFLSVTYAGFIGCITGMNAEKISLGEIGGLGYGKWDGIPMSFLLRSLLEDASSLEEAKTILSSAKRTCEYYYIVGDGKVEQSFACYATPDQIKFLSSGKDYCITPSSSLEEDHLFLTEDPLPQNDHSLFFHQPKDTLLLTGTIAPERYPILEKRISDHYGSIDAKALIDVIKQPVARPSNLHNAIFHPSSLRVWVAHAGPLGPELEPACDQPYHCYCLNDLVKT